MTWLLHLSNCALTSLSSSAKTELTQGGRAIFFQPRGNKYDETKEGKGEGKKKSNLILGIVEPPSSLGPHFRTSCYARKKGTPLLLIFCCLKPGTSTMCPFTTPLKIATLKEEKGFAQNDRVSQWQSRTKLSLSVCKQEALFVLHHP